MTDRPRTITTTRLEMIARRLRGIRSSKPRSPAAHEREL